MMVFAIKSEKCRSNSESPRLGKMGAPNLSQKPRNSLKKERMSHISRILLNPDKSESWRSFL